MYCGSPFSSIHFRKCGNSEYARIVKMKAVSKIKARLAACTGMADCVCNRTKSGYYGWAAEAGSIPLRPAEGAIWGPLRTCCDSAYGRTGRPAKRLTAKGKTIFIDRPFGVTVILRIELVPIWNGIILFGNACPTSKHSHKSDTK